jgi:hypothetical protein
MVISYICVFKECILLCVITIYIYVSFSFSCQTQQKQTPNNSLTFHCAYLSLFGWDSTSDESRRNSVSLNRVYISNNTLNISNYDPRPNINIINNTREDSHIVCTTFPIKTTSFTPPSVIKLHLLFAHAFTCFGLLVCV